MPKSVILYKEKLLKRVTVEKININKRGRGSEEGEKLEIVKNNAKSSTFHWQNRRGCPKWNISTLGNVTPFEDQNTSRWCVLVLKWNTNVPTWAHW